MEKDSFTTFSMAIQVYFCLSFGLHERRLPPVFCRLFSALQARLKIGLFSALWKMNLFSSTEYGRYPGTVLVSGPLSLYELCLQRAVLGSPGCPVLAVPWAPWAASVSRVCHEVPDNEWVGFFLHGFIQYWLKHLGEEGRFSRRPGEL